MSARIADILLRAKVIDDMQLAGAKAHQSQWGGRLAQVIVEKRLAKEAAIVDAIAAGFRLPKTDLNNVTHNAALLARIDEPYAREKALFPVEQRDNGKVLVVAMADPGDLATIDQLQLKTRARIITVVAAESKIMEAIDRHYLGKEPAKYAPTAFGSIAPPESQDFGSDDEMKVVDMSGRTVVRRISDIQPPAPAPKPAPQAPLPPPVAAAPAASGAGALLDDLLGPATSKKNWSPAQLERLRQIKDAQDKSGLVLRTVLELCLEKGLITAEEYKARVGRG